MSTFVVVQFVAAQLLDVPMQRRESRAPSMPAASHSGIRLVIGQKHAVCSWQSVVSAKIRAKDFRVVFQRLFLKCLVKELYGVWSGSPLAVELFFPGGQGFNMAKSLCSGWLEVWSFHLQVPGSSALQCHQCHFCLLACFFLMACAKKNAVYEDLL